MKISFVIPAHNEEDFLEDCLKSIFSEINNNHCSAEVIVVDNASTDNTLNIASRFPGVKIVEEPVKGLSRARQAGFLASSGELIANVDSDTRLPAGWMKIVLANYKNNPKLVALSGPHVYYDVPKRVSLLVKIYNVLSYIAYFFNRFIFRIGSLVQGGNFVVRRSVLEENGGYNVQFSFYGEDADIAKRFFKLGDVKYTFDLFIFASGRRLMAEGKIKMGYLYFINYLWTIFFGRPFSSSAPDIRLKPSVESESFFKKKI